MREKEDSMFPLPIKIIIVIGLTTLVFALFSVLAADTLEIKVCEDAGGKHVFTVGASSPICVLDGEEYYIVSKKPFSFIPGKELVKIPK